jgi:outer membrane protein OmpA-like peptidoglycan-associated protein
MKSALLLRPTVLFGAVMFSVACTTAPGQPNPMGQLEEAFASKDPCSNNARNIGMVSGAVLGAVLGNAMGGGKDDSRLIGAAFGGVLGGLVGADMDRKRCELSKLAKQYDLDITFANIEVQREAPTTPSPKPAVEAAEKSNAAEAPAIIGNSVTVRDRGGAAGHFESGSDQLTPRAREYFAAIARQYAPSTIADAQIGAKQKADALNQLAKRRLLLVGHTDDTGATQLNATLSERRASAVAAFLRQQGIAEDTIFYQGAGESLPIANNRTEDGRALNRRVEIVEIADEAGFKKYLESRKPNLAFYRSPTDLTPLVAEAPAAPKLVPPAASAKAKKPATSAVASAPANSTAAASSPPANALPRTKPAPQINFGGIPYSPATATIELGAALPEKRIGLISSAQADDSILAKDCSYDRPRAQGSVKSLRDGRIYKTTDHLPQLYGKTWATIVNGNLLVLNHLAILRSGGTPANLPELKVYANYKGSSSDRPSISEEPAVNSYLVEKGALYRVFPSKDGVISCMDILFGVDGATTARAGKLIYLGSGTRYVADFKPQLQ